MNRLLVFTYSLLVYSVSLVVILYSIGFVGNFIVPKSIDTGADGPLFSALLINLLLLAVFALQHSIMARPQFKRVWTKVVSPTAERSTYVLLTSLALMLIFVYWQPMTTNVWDVSGTMAGTVLSVLFWSGWLIVLASTFMIDHFDLFGLKRAYMQLCKREFIPGPFRKTAFYQFVRHPIMTGFLVAFWATPVMSSGHLLFALVTSAYIAIAVLHWEEKDLIAEIGDEYRDYRRQVAPFFPGIGKGK